MNREHILNAAVFISAWIFIGCSPTPTPTPVAAPSANGVVTIEIRTGDRVDSTTIDSVADGSTLESVLRSIEEPEFVIKGSGPTAFVDRIGDRSTGASDGWTFKIDGKFSDRGVGTVLLHPPATVTWQFGSMEDTMADGEP